MAETAQDEFLAQDFVVDKEALYKKEEERLRDIILRMFCPLEEIDGIMESIMSKAREADALVEQIKNHPLIQKSYTYRDGVFNRDDGKSMTFVPDGPFLLRRLVRGNMSSFGSLLSAQARDELLDFIDSDVQVCRKNLKLLEERGDITPNSSDFAIIERVSEDRDNSEGSDVKDIGNDKWVN